MRPGFVKISYKLHVITRLEAEDRIGTKNNESSDIDGQHKNLSEKVKGKYSSGNQVSTHMKCKFIVSSLTTASEQNESRDGQHAIALEIDDCCHIFG